MLTLFCYGATKTLWFSTVARDREGQIAWAEKIAEEYAKVVDIRLMSDLTLADIKTMELVWAQAASRLNTYAANKIPNPKLPDPKPVEVKKKEEEEPKREPEKPVDPVKEEPKPVEKKSGTMKIIGSIATVLLAIMAWLPIPAPIKAIARVILSAIASIFK
jgi:hypothetical protein